MDLWTSLEQLSSTVKHTHITQNISEAVDTGLKDDKEGHKVLKAAGEGAGQPADFRTKGVRGSVPKFRALAPRM